MRKILPHVPPHPVRDSWFFITICCAIRGPNQLCLAPIADGLIGSAARYHHQRHWTLHLFLLMPDHVHLIAAFPPEANMSDVIRNWKRITAKRLQVAWQRNYFDHRVRPEEGLQQKTDYIRQNPVRAGLVQRTEDWPYRLDATALEGR